MACKPTRPNIANAVRAVARYANKPREVHWSTAIAILNYVFGTNDFGATFQGGRGLELVGFANADYASKAADRRSVSGGAVMCAGACVSWFSRTQKCVTLSTTEAEYVAKGDTVKEAMFIRYVWSSIFPGFGATCLTVFEDNEGARHLAQSPVRTSNSKHIDVRHHFLRELIFRGEFIISHVGGSACRLSYEATQQCGFYLLPGFSDDYLMHFRDRRFCIWILVTGLFFRFSMWIIREM